MVDFVNTQYSLRQGEIGDFFRGQSHLETFHLGLCEAENCFVNMAGGIYRRDPVKYVIALPQSLNGQYKIVTLTVNDNFIVLFFSENRLDVFQYSNNGLNLLFTKQTTYSLERMNYSWHCLVHGQKADDMDDAVVFTNRLYKPLVLTILNDGLAENDYVFKEVSPASVPMVRIRKDDLTGVQAGTGNVTCKYQFSQWILSTTNPVFTDDSWIGAEFDIGGATWRIQNILSNGGQKLVSCALLEGSVQAYENIDPSEIFFRKGFERIADDIKGWFTCCAFGNGRLFFANAKSRPNAIVGSCFRNLLDFDLNIASKSDAVFAELDLESGEYITSMKITNSIYVFTNRGMFVCPTTDVNSGNFHFSRAQTHGGIDAFTEAIQLAENGLIGISSSKNKIYYIQFADDENAYKAAPISPVMEPRMIAQSGGVFNATVIDEGKTIGQNFYYITSEFDIVKVLLTFDKEALPGYTRYDFSDRYAPTKLFAVDGKLFIVFLDLETNQNFLGYIDNRLDDKRIPLFKERPCVDFYIEIDDRHDIEDKKVIELPGWIDAKEDIWFIRNRTFDVYKVTRIGDNKYRAPFDISNGQLGVFFAPYIETMETVGSPQTVGGQAFGKTKNIKYLAFGAEVCFSELWIAMINAISTDIPERKPVKKFFKYINGTNAKPVYDPGLIDYISGTATNPALCMTQFKPGVFYFSTYCVVTGMAGNVVNG